MKRFLSALSFFLLSLWAVQAQEIALDPRVQTGKLPNGFTYYIQHNPKPANKVELRLVVNAGSVLEEDHESGLAHFTEHMAFNGSAHFEKNELVSYLQRVGVQFGGDLNAFTSFDETVYMLPIPSDDPEVLENGFLVLRDWAVGLSFEEEEVENEKGIIEEEWRGSLGFSQRFSQTLIKTLLAGSAYPDRLPIGDIEIVKGADAATLRGFYERWYRPENMALVAVGDVDEAILRQLTEKYFGDIAPTATGFTRPQIVAPMPTAPVAKVLRDEEAPGTISLLVYSLPAVGYGSQGALRERLQYTLYAALLNQRFAELSEEPDSPFLFASASYSPLVRSVDNFMLQGVAKDGAAEATLRALAIEANRAAQHGFTAQEIERAKKSILNNVERSAKEADKKESAALVSRYQSHFLGQGFGMDEATTLAIYTDLLPKISVADIQRAGQQMIQHERSASFFLAPPVVAGIPEEAETFQLLAEVAAMELAPKDEELLAERLLAEVPEAGRVASTRYHEDLDVKAITFENGARVFYKQTDFKNDEVLFRVLGKGGISLTAEEDHYSAISAGVLVNTMGVGDFDPTQLKKVLAGKSLSVTPNIGRYSQDMSGYFSPKDAEEALQLIYLYFTAPRKDEKLFQVYINNNKEYLRSAAGNPDFQFSVALSELMANNHPRAMGINSPEQFDRINLDRAIHIYRERFANAGNFDFFFTGNIDPEQFETLAAQYIGSLPGTSTRETPQALAIFPPQQVNERFFIGQDQKSTVFLRYGTQAPYTKEEARAVGYLSDALSIILIEEIREKLSGVYSISASGEASRAPDSQYGLSIYFPCSPDQTETLIAAVREELQKIVEKGIPEETLAKVKEKRKRSYRESLNRNAYWNAQLTAIFHEESFSAEELFGYEEIIENFPAEAVQRMAAKLFKEEQALVVQQLPADFNPEISATEAILEESMP